MHPNFEKIEMKEALFSKSKLEQNEIRVFAQLNIESFWPSLGFRRIGSSVCFGLAADRNHKAHTILLDHDFNLPWPRIEAIQNVEQAIDSTSVDPIRDLTITLMKLKILREQFPLHHATIKLSDADCVKFYKETARVEGLSGQAWNRVDPFPNNISHLAALQLKAKSIQWIKNNIERQCGRPCHKLLRSGLNNVGYSPLEDLESTLEHRRITSLKGVRTGTCSKFNGLSDEAVSCIASLQRRRLRYAGMERLRLKDKCTCNQCLGGFVSPRMNLAHIYEAGVCLSILHRSDYIAEGPDDKYFMHGGIIAHVSPGIRGGLITDTSLRSGSAKVSDHIISTMRDGQPPTNRILLG